MMGLSALDVECAQSEKALQKIAGYQPQYDMTDVVSSRFHYSNPCSLPSFQNTF
jgi:hypothetical protein